MKILGYIFGLFMIVLGVLFAIAAASTGVWQRWILAGVLGGAGLAVIYFIRMKVPDQKVTVKHEIELTGDVHLEEMKCRNCGGTLDSKSVTMQDGALFANCPFCGTSYQVEEAPKW